MLVLTVYYMPRPGPGRPRSNGAPDHNSGRWKYKAKAEPQSVGATKKARGQERAWFGDDKFVGDLAAWRAIWSGCPQDEGQDAAPCAVLEVQ